MDPVFKKLNFKDHQSILVLNAPYSFQPNLEVMENETSIQDHIETAKQITFLLAFVTKKEEIAEIVPLIATQLKGDALVWIAYPKKSSKRYRSDISRDEGWAPMGEAGLEPVRMVAIDQDWSALRFRKVGFIKKITRSKKMALTKEAKERTTNRK